jgi:hypothetical protein
MVTNVKPFVGQWPITWVAGNSGVTDQWQLFIGTNSQYGDFPPTLTSDFQVSVGFALLDENGTVQLGTGQGPNPPLPLLFTQGTLRGVGEYQGRPVRVYISVADARMAGGSESFSLYGSSFLGDPDQVGVWGADGNPASQPPRPCP